MPLAVTVSIASSGYLTESQLKQLEATIPVLRKLTTVTEPFEFQGKTITPQNMYTGLFVIGEYEQAAATVRDRQSVVPCIALLQ